MILRAGSVAAVADADNPTRVALGDAGRLTQLGAFVQMLRPGERTSELHWHASSDELLYVRVGEITVVEGTSEHALGPGDAAVWPAGVPDPLERREER